MRAKIISLYFMRLRLYHVNLEYTQDELKTFTHLLLKRVIADIKRRNNEIDTRKRISITRDVFLVLLEKSN